MGSLRTIFVALAVLGLSQSALAFGTITVAGQNAEHERITRHALACGQAGVTGACFQSYSIDQLAGKSGTFGAVGAPDNPTRGLITAAYAHCDNGDYLGTPGYPQSQQAAEAQLVNCRNWMVGSMNAAVSNSGPMLKNGKIDDSQIPTYVSCTFNGQKGRAKCNALESFGVILHAAQDFYSHSNWTDQAGPGGISPNNVPGLNNRSNAPWLDFRRANPFPAGLITGCFELGVPPDFDGIRGCPNRATHYYLNKDKGQIDPVLGAGTTPRGQINNNFANAVTAAIAETRDKWAYLQERLVAQYGARNGQLMICALTHDNAAKDCK